MAINFNERFFFFAFSLSDCFIYFFPQVLINVWSWELYDKSSLPIFFFLGKHNFPQVNFKQQIGSVYISICAWWVQCHG